METLVLVSGSEEIALHGPEVTAPVRGSRRAGVTAAEGGWTERVDVYLEGRPGEMQAVRERIERMLAQIETARLRMTPYPGGMTVEARLAGASCCSLDGSPANGSGGMRLELTRREAWQGAEIALPLSNPYGQEVTTGIEISTQSGGASWNYADIAGQAMGVDQPGALRVEIENASTSENLGAARLCLDAGAYAFQDGLGLACDAGQTVSVSGTAGLLASWPLDSDLAARLAGRVVRPAARFAAAPADGAVWAWLQVSRDETALWISGRELLDDARLQDLPAVCLPDLDVPAGVNLELWGKTGGAASSLRLDSVQLCPLDRWRRYQALGGLPPGGVLADDGYSGRVWARTAEGEVGSFTASGPAPRLLPGRDQRLYLLHDGSADLPLRLRAWYRPAWGCL